MAEDDEDLPWYRRPEYQDQAIVIDQTGERDLVACFTPDGIRRREQRLNDSIFWASTPGELNKIVQAIQDDDHLHKDLKVGLLLNVTVARERLKTHGAVPRDFKP